MRLADGRFELRRKLGEGGFGVVYAAFDRERGEEVALKRLTRMDPQMLYGFKQEFRALQGLRHPNLVQMLELFADGHEWFFTMELVSGVRFTDWVRRRMLDPERANTAQGAQTKPLAEVSKFASDTTDDASDATRKVSEQAKKVDDETRRVGDASASVEEPQGDGASYDEERLRASFHQLVSGVTALHQAGMLHCDLKPSNVLVVPDGRVVVLDFGLVRQTAKTHTGPSVGTPNYMSPEQVEGGQLAEASDWYSAGVMLFESLTGILPFRGAPMLVMHQKTSRDAPRAKGPPDLVQLCDALLQRDVRRRVVPFRHVPQNKEARSLGLLVARDAELEALKRAGTRVLVTGPSGVGKSALIEHFVANADRLAFASRCYEQESVPYKGIDGLVDEIRQWLRDPQVPLLAMMDRVGRPVVLVVDDAQWGDADSARVLLHWLKSPGVSVIMTCREPSGPFVQALAPYETIDVRPLDTRASAELARALGAADPERTAREGRGDPLLIETLVHDAVSIGETLPSVEASVARRVACLDAQTRRLLEMVACAGTPIEERLLGASQVQLATLAQRRLIKGRNARAKVWVESAHDRVRAAVISRLPSYAVRLHHAQLAERLADSASDEVVGVHLHAAGDDARASECFARAAERAQHMQAFDRAARLYTQAVATAPYAKSADLYDKLSRALAAAGRTVDAQQAKLSAAALATPR